jgi:hypothetical protein
MKLGFKAHRNLVNQGICKAWQMHVSRVRIHSHAQFNDALIRLFVMEKEEIFSVTQLFAFVSVWIGDGAGKIWKVQVDKGMAGIVVERGIDVCDERRVYLSVGFALLEVMGCVGIEDVERGMVQEEDWMVVQFEDSCQM